MFTYFKKIFSSNMSETNTWLAALTACLFNTTGMLMITFFKPHFNIPNWPTLSSATIGFILSLILFAKQSSISKNIATVIYILNASCVVLFLYLIAPYYTEFAPTWQTFRPNQLGSIVAALTAPRFIAGAYAIAIHSFVPILQFLTFIPDSQFQAISAEVEVIASLAFGVAGFFILVFQFHRLHVEERLRNQLAQNMADQAVAKNFLLIRDLMNTPLQSLMLAIEIMSKNGTSNELINQCRRSIDELEKLNLLLKVHEKDVDWTQFSYNKNNF